MQCPRCGSIKNRKNGVGSVLDVLLGSVESLPGQSSSSSGNISETPPKS